MVVVEVQGSGSGSGAGSVLPPQWVFGFCVESRKAHTAHAL